MHSHASSTGWLFHSSVFEKKYKHENFRKFAKSVIDFGNSYKTPVGELTHARKRLRRAFAVTMSSNFPPIFSFSERLTNERARLAEK